MTSGANIQSVLTDLFQRDYVEEKTGSSEDTLQLSHCPPSLLHRLAHSTPLWKATTVTTLLENLITRIISENTEVNHY